MRRLPRLRVGLTVVIPQQVAALDVARAVPADRDFLLPDWRERSADLFFEIPLRLPVTNLRVLVCVLLEHQSAADPYMPLRLLLYATCYWEREWKRWETDRPRGQALQLPPIIPIVFHTGATPWHTNRRMSDLIATPPLFQPFAPDWEVHFFDLAGRTPESLLSAASPLLEALAVVRAERADAEAFQEILIETLRRLAPLESRERIRWSELMRFVLSWAARRRPREEQTGLRELVQTEVKQRPLPQEVFTMNEQIFQTNEDWLLEQGELRGLRKSVRTLLSARFQQVPPDILHRIKAEENLERLLECLKQVG